MSQQQQHGNGLSDKRGRGGPTNTLELYDGIVNPDTYDDVVAKLGSGYYERAEQWQQVESFKKGMFGDAAFGRALAERARAETIFELGRQGWRWWDDNDEQYRHKEGTDVDPDSLDPRESPRERIWSKGNHIWRLLDEQEQLNAMVEYAGATGDFMPPHWRMMEARHEASKSRDARTQDNAFGTRSKSNKRVQHEGESSSSGRFSFRERRSAGGQR